MGRLMVRLLMRTLDGEAATPVVTPTRLIRRAST